MLDSVEDSVIWTDCVSLIFRLSDFSAFIVLCADVKDYLFLGGPTKRFPNTT